MNIKFTISYTARFDLEQAYSDFHEILYRDPEKDMDRALYNAVEANIDWPRNQEEYPNEVVETAATALRKRIGGVQTEMELD